MNKHLLDEVLSKIGKVSVGVVGDFCLDVYWSIDESRSEVSIETGKRTLPVREQKYSLGGAGNVANNLIAMGVERVVAFGVVGIDPFGREMVSLMQKAKIDTENIIVQKENCSTLVYTKPCINDEEQGRIDFGDFNLVSEETSDNLIERLKNNIGNLDIVIINEQVLSGINTAYFRRRLGEVVKSFPEKIFIVDSRHYANEFDGAYRKMNDLEAANMCGLQKTPSDIVSSAEVKKCAESLYQKYMKPVFVTRGGRGSLAVDASGIIEIPCLHIISKIDSVGAGDSYLSGVAAALGAGFDKTTAAELGTFVAGVTVQKLFQTGTASPEEIKEIGTNPDFIYNPELAEDLRHARYFDDSEIEIVNPLPQNINVRYVIFDHDGTVSTLREGWEKIMAPMMMKAVLGDSYATADDALYHKVHERVTEFIDKTTGIQTLVQMQGLVDIVREFGLVKKEDILDEFGYKRIYNDELLKMVRAREQKLERGELTADDYSMKNSVALLTRLREAGITLYLASGTDEDDVKNEAAIMGYKDLFNGGIFGSVGDVTKEAKKMVLDRILNTIGDSASGELVTFGDGPVEIRETHKRGGITVGVASNEQRRFGLNESKRTRLIKAGADVIVPDFSQMPILLSLLNIR